MGEQQRLKQQVIATATVYFKRFYACNSVKCIDPLLLAPTSVFLASKVEEHGVISVSKLVNTCILVGKFILLEDLRRIYQFITIPEPFFNFKLKQ